MALLALAGCTRPTRSATAPVPGRPDVTGARAEVVHVVDGDTVDIEIGGARERVRLLGIDTPETVKPDTPVQCYGPEASARTKALVPPGTEVLVQRDAEARDRYGRFLLYVWRARDGLFVNASLVRDGYARILSIRPNTAHRAELAALAAAAEQSGRGLWGACSGPGGDQPR